MATTFRYEFGVTIDINGRGKSRATELAFAENGIGITDCKLHCAIQIDGEITRHLIHADSVVAAASLGVIHIGNVQRSGAIVIRNCSTRSREGCGARDFLTTHIDFGSACAHRHHCDNQ